MFIISKRAALLGEDCLHPILDQPIRLTQNQSGSIMNKLILKLIQCRHLTQYLSHRAILWCGLATHDLVIRTVQFDALDEKNKRHYDKCLKAVFRIGLQEYIRKYSAPEWLLLGYNGSRIVASLYLVDRCALIDGNTFRACGIGGVFTKVAVRGLGYAKQLMQLAQQIMVNRPDIDFGLLLCSRKLTPFYARLGWDHIDCPVYIDSIRWDMDAMVFRKMVLPAPQAIQVDGALW